MPNSLQERHTQQFLLEPYASEQLSRRLAMRAAIAREMASDTTDVEGKSLLSASSAENEFEYITLLFSSGAPPEQLRGVLTNVVVAYERYQNALATFEQAPKMSPLGLDQLGDYERAMQIIGLCVLLHRPDLLDRMAAMIDPGYKGEDTLYEDLLAFYQAGRIGLDEWYHDEPYSPLVRAIYEQDNAAASSLLNEYVEGWYPAFKYVPWHDGHLRINGTDGDYFGYWAFEAGAVAYLCNIDDSAIAHMIYPKELVTWARAHVDLSGTTSDKQQKARLRCEGGQSCPMDGWWEMPAKADSRRHFKQGEIMPKLEADYGRTIWGWIDDASN